jgi:hypothetical protein
MDGFRINGLLVRVVREGLLIGVAWQPQARRGTVPGFTILIPASWHHELTDILRAVVREIDKYIAC